MDLSSELVVQFAKLNADKDSDKKENLVYGTAVKYGNDMYVKMDGSDLLTPIDTTTDIQDGERVLVTVKDHNAIVTGNLSNPSASTSTVESISGNVTELSVIVADKADIKDLHATNATIENLKVNKAEIEDLKATNAEITNLKAEFAEIDTLVSGNISSVNIQTGGITGENLNMDTVIVKDANIESVNASKVNSGILNTNMVDVQSESGNLKITDNTIQIKDTEKVRVQIGKDASGDYSMSVWDVSGKLMFDARGLTSDAIKTEIIRNDMVATDANISGGKLDIDSVISEVNQNGTVTLKSSKVQLDSLNQTLDVAFTTLKTQADETKSLTESNTTQLGIEQGRINTLIQDTTIDREGEQLTLKDVYTKLEQTVGGISSVVGNHTSMIEDVINLGEATSQQVWDTNFELSSFKQDVNGFKTTVSQTYATKGEVSQVSSEVSQTADKLKMEFTQSGGTNKLRNSAFKNGYNHWSHQRWDDTAEGTSYIEVVYPENSVYTPSNRNSIACAVVGIPSWAAGFDLRAGFDSHLFTVKPNTTYTLNCYCAGHRITNYYIEMLCYDSSGTRLPGNNAVRIDNVRYGGRDRNDWNKIKHTFTTQAEAVNCQLRAYIGTWDGRLESAFLWMCEPIVCEGDVEIPWSPNADEVFTGITSVDKDGVKVSHSNINGYSQMSADSFRLNKDGNDVLKLDHNGLSITNGNVQVSHYDGSYTRMAYDGFRINKNGMDILKVDDYGMSMVGRAIEVSHNDGSYTRMAHDGFTRYVSGTSSTYHYLFDVVVVDGSGKCDGTWFNVQLPEVFKGKNFKLAWQMGNGSVPINKVWAGHQVDVRYIDIWNATCQVSIKVFTKSQFSGGASADASAYGWAKLFIIC